MGDLLKKAASPEVLNASWKRLKNEKTRIVPAGPKVVFLGRKLPGKKQVKK